MTDRYKKFVLTAIAMCLAILAGKALVEPARAQFGATHVIVDAWGINMATYPIPVHAQ